MTTIVGTSVAPASMASLPVSSRMELAHHRLYEFAKTALIKIFVSPYASVCDLYCGGGTDTDKWDEAQIGHYVGVDISSSGISEAREIWESQMKSYTADFFESDPSIENLELHLQDKGIPVDIVCCLQHLQLCFEYEERVRMLLHNVSSFLKPGGYFFGITPDSSTIWTKYQKIVEASHNKGSGLKGVQNCIRSENFVITFEVEEEKFPFFGKKYMLKFANDIASETHCLVHFPSLIRLAREAGLEYVEIRTRIISPGFVRILYLLPVVVQLWRRPRLGLREVSTPRSRREERMSGSAFNAIKARVPVAWSPRLFITLVRGLPGTRKLHRRTLAAMRLRCCNRTVIHRTTPSLLGMLNQVKRLVVVETEEMHNARKQEEAQRRALRPPIVIKHAPAFTAPSPAME